MTKKQKEAYDIGYKAGYNEDGQQCPYPADSDEKLYWLSGYNQSLDDLIVKEVLISKLLIEMETLKQKIEKLIDAGDVMYTLLDPPSISMRTTEYDNALQGWDDAKIMY